MRRKNGRWCRGSWLNLLPDIGILCKHLQVTSLKCASKDWDFTWSSLEACRQRTPGHCPLASLGAGVVAAEWQNGQMKGEGEQTQSKTTYRFPSRPLSSKRKYFSASLSHALLLPVLICVTGSENPWSHTVLGYTGLPKGCGLCFVTEPSLPGDLLQICSKSVVRAREQQVLQTPRVKQGS